MFGFRGVVLPEKFARSLSFLNSFGVEFGQFFGRKDDIRSIGMVILILIMSLVMKNSMELRQRFQPKWYFGLYCAAIITLSLIMIKPKSEFIYFKF